MTFDAGLIIKIAVTLLAGIIGIGSVYILKMPYDNSLEEAAEEIIKEQTELNFDLSSDSQEDK